MAIQTPNITLSSNDARILDAIFDPETLPSSAASSKDASLVDSSLFALPTIAAAQLAILETQQNNIIRRVPWTSSLSSIEVAIAQEDEIVREWPTYPSALVNRAMLRRIKMQTPCATGGGIFTSEEPEVEALFADLSRAIRLSLSSPSPLTPVSPYQARILRTAYSHRAYLYLKAAESGVELRGHQRNELEELASRDFAAAARYGDETAKEMSVRTNPYAKMCSAIVRNALAKERKEHLGTRFTR